MPVGLLLVGHLVSELSVMETSVRRLVIVAAAIALGAMPTRAAQPLDALLRAEVEGLAAMLSDGFARFDHADAQYGLNDTPFAERVVVLFSLTSWGGGNGSRQFLAVMERNDASVEFPDGRRARHYQLIGVIQVGDDFERWFKSFSLQGDRVVLKGRRWTKGDAHCCPSLDTDSSYRVTSHGLSEVTR
jgi:hypothetical protein